MNKEQIIEKLDSYPWDTPTESALLVGFNESQAICLHRVKVGGTVSKPIITIMVPNIESDVTFEHLEKNFINYSCMEFMSHQEFMSKYKDIYDAQRKLSSKKILENKKKNAK